MAKITVSNIHGTTIELRKTSNEKPYMVIVKTMQGVTSLDVASFDEAIEIYENCVKGELESMNTFLRSQHGGQN